MTVISTTKDPENLTLTLVAEFDSTPERVWSVWEDPRKLEQWWGPPGWPATFTRHDFVVGGESRYHLTGPAGEVHHAAIGGCTRSTSRSALNSPTGSSAPTANRRRRSRR